MDGLGGWLLVWSSVLDEDDIDSLRYLERVRLGSAVGLWGLRVFGGIALAGECDGWKYVRIDLVRNVARILARLMLRRTILVVLVIQCSSCRIGSIIIASMGSIKYR